MSQTNIDIVDFSKNNSTENKQVKEHFRVTGGTAVSHLCPTCTNVDPSYMHQNQHVPVVDFSSKERYYKKPPPIRL